MGYQPTETIIRYFPWKETACFLPKTTISGTRVGMCEKIFERKVFPMSGGTKFQYATALDLLLPEAGEPDKARFTVLPG